MVMQSREWSRRALAIAGVVLSGLGLFLVFSGTGTVVSLIGNYTIFLGVLLMAIRRFLGIGKMTNAPRS
jgi:hypothetical protein